MIFDLMPLFEGDGPVQEVRIIDAVTWIQQILPLTFFVCTVVYTYMAPLHFPDYTPLQRRRRQKGLHS